MAQNPWLEMFDRRMSDLHQLEYLRQQMSEAQAARQQRAYEFSKGLEENALDRGLKQQQLAAAANAQKLEDQRAFANLLSKGAQLANVPQPIDMLAGSPNFGLGQSGEPVVPGNAMIGSQAVNVPSPLQLAQQQASFDETQRLNKRKLYMESLDSLGLDDLNRAVAVANYDAKALGGGPVLNSSFTNEDRWSQHLKQSLNEKLSPAEREYHKKMADGLMNFEIKRRQASGLLNRGSLPPAAAVDDAVEQGAGWIIGQIGINSPGLLDNVDETTYRSTVMREFEKYKDQLEARFGKGYADRVRNYLFRNFVRPGEKDTGFFNLPGMSGSPINAPR